jgi:1,4-alpha-glucan branching enzyme
MNQWTLAFREKHMAGSQRISRKVTEMRSEEKIQTDTGGSSLARRNPWEVAPAESFISDDDLYLFNEGTHARLYEKLGAHHAKIAGAEGTYFAVWAPNAEAVFVTGSFNDWNKETHPLSRRANSGIWEGFIPGVDKGTLYKYFVKSRSMGYRADKSDPFSIFNEIPPKTASIVWDLEYPWGDGDWMATRRERNALNKPISIYEMHLGSWRRVPEEGNRSLSYRELAPLLVDHLRQTGFTHVEFLPVMDHPFFGSWGYQITGYFAPSGNYGTPQDLMYLIDALHQNGFGVILDWVPSHFPSDEHGLAYFDGTHLFEHADPRQGYHPEWNSYIFNYGRHEVRSFLISNALFWLDKYHIDGLRVDAVASMLYLDYARREGEWVPNRYGGRENLDAIEFLKHFNSAIYENYSDVQTIAEESTSWPMVSRPVYAGGLGFGLKWDMGWMHDTLKYFSNDPVYRKFHHNNVTFRMLYAFHENFVLPLSHDEVVYGKGSLLNKMPGDDWQRFANLRLLLGYMYAQPGKKLLFMGGEIAQWSEWRHDGSLDWQILHSPLHAGVQKWVGDLNALYRSAPALHELDSDASGFEWIDCNDADASVVSLMRKGRAEESELVVVCNFTPVARQNYRVGVPRGGSWKERLNSDARDYGGSGAGNMGAVEASPLAYHGRHFSLSLSLPPLSILFLVNERG